MTHKITRRDFLRATGLTGVSLLGGQALLACSDDESAPADTSNNTANNTANNDPIPDAGMEPDAVEDTGDPPMDADEPPQEDRWWLEDNYAPVEDDLEAFDLEVEGAIPPGLRGLYVRNGSNPSTGLSSHWFFGDGMLHGVRIEDGQARWYRSRYVQTGLLGEDGGIGAPDIRKNHGNTSIIQHAGRLLTLNEVGLPHHINPEDLSTHGVFDFDGALQGPMTAHPKIDPATGHMHFFGYNFFAPYLSFSSVDSSGNLIRQVDLNTPASTMMHDFQITDQHAVFMDLPILFDLQAAIGGDFPFAWRPDNGSRLGVMPLDGAGDDDVQWFEIDNCFVFHTMGAFRDPDNDQRIVLLGARHADMWADGPHSFSRGANLWRWTLDLSTGQSTEEAIDDRFIEFPQLNLSRQGLSMRYGYALGYSDNSGADSPGDPQALLKYDLSTGEVQEHRFAQGRVPGEAVFVPGGEGEDEGWLMTYVYDKANNSSSLDIFDATNLQAPPVASIKLPRRVPYGFHGTWVPDA